MLITPNTGAIPVPETTPIAKDCCRWIRAGGLNRSHWLPRSAWQPLLVPLHSHAERGNEECGALESLAPTLCVVVLAGTVAFPRGAWERGKIFRREYRQFTAVTQARPAYSQVAA